MRLLLGAAVAAAALAAAPAHAVEICNPNALRPCATVNAEACRLHHLFC